MVTVLTGDNSFEIREALKTLEGSFQGHPEHIDGATLTLANIPDLLMGVSLFSEERLVVIDQLSASAAVWSRMSDWLSRISDTIHLVLIEPSLDKRTTTYKALKAVADIQTFAAWTDKDATKAEVWAVHHAKEQQVLLTRQVAAHLIKRVGVDQWRISQAVNQLALLEDSDITPALIDSIIVPSIEESVFQLLDATLNGDAQEAVRMVRALERTEEPHRLMALIVSQVFSLAATVLAPEEADPAKDFGVHPFVISKLRRFRRSLGVAGALGMVQCCARADTDLKSSKAEPWVLVERLVVQLAHRKFS